LVSSNVERICVIQLTNNIKGFFMTRYLIAVVLSLWMVVSAVPADAAVEWESGPKLNIGSTPRDIAVSSDGKLTFVLTVDGKVLIFSSDGSLENTIQVKNSVDSLDISPDGMKLYLGDREAKTLETINLSLVYEINTAGAPYKGAAEAPVVIAVFSDFQ